ncbi:hypothetical protein UFOVP1313_4 [uncultured Caudovirales phage]|uniref:DUF2190 domain-containing protein n=1 Tax=uncultured Caudovirales phage TaxID=2100421 RepID=A0A6J5RSQ5_9CAUD|nr:hypothetical protein UFOVP1313_4 [uncultured Caudovirales phage]
MPENVQSPVHMTSDITAVADGALVGGRFVKITGKPGDGENYYAETATAAAKAFGIAVHDVADGERVSLIGTPGRIVKATAGGTIAAGAQVQIGTDGKVVVLASGVPVGTALSAGVAAGSIDIKLA